MAALAIAYVVIGFAIDEASAEMRPGLEAAEAALTAVFIAEFLVRFLASFDRLRYLREHALDLVALLPVARGLRLARLLRLLRLVRTFSGLRRAFTSVEQLANHHGLGTLVIAWFGTMFLCSSAFYAVESGINPGVDELGDAVWWGIATLTGGTSGVQAVTDEGRIATAALLILGVALFSAITAVLVSFIVSTSSAASDVDGRLRELSALHADGVLTDEEFRSAKSAVLMDLGPRPSGSSGGGER